MGISFMGAIFFLVGLAAAIYRGGARIQQVPVRALGLGVSLLGGLMITASTVTVIGVGEVGVVHAFGLVDPDPLLSGIRIVRPWAQVEKFSVREIQFPGGGLIEAMDALSREQMAVDVEVAVRYRIEPQDVVVLYTRIGDRRALEAAVLNAIRAGVRDGMAKHGINEIEFRDSIAASMSAAVQGKLAVADIEGVDIAHVTQLFLRKITPPAVVAEAINAKIQQEQQIQTEAFRVQVEEQRALRRITEAEGIAEAQRIINVTLTPRYLMREYITSLVAAAESPGTTIIFPTDRGLPVFDMSRFTRQLPDR